jgi:hypothetical protein
MYRDLLARRAMLSLIAAGALFSVGVGLSISAGLAQTASPAAPEAVRFKAIKVDFAPLRDNGSAVYADWLAQTLPAALDKAFAARLAPGDRGAPTLVVRVDQVTLGSPGMLTGMGGLPRLNDTTDQVEGAASVVGPGERTISTTPIHTSAPADTNVPPPMMEQNNHDRVAMAGRVFAYWLPSQMGL